MTQGRKWYVTKYSFRDAVVYSSEKSSWERWHLNLTLHMNKFGYVKLEMRCLRLRELHGPKSWEQFTADSDKQCQKVIRGQVTDSFAW